MTFWRGTGGWPQHVPNPWYSGSGGASYLLGGSVGTYMSGSLRSQESVRCITSYVAGTNGRKVQRHNGTRQLDQVPGGPMAQASRRTEVPYLPSWPFRSLTLFFPWSCFLGNATSHQALP